MWCEGQTHRGISSYCTACTKRHCFLWRVCVDLPLHLFWIQVACLAEYVFPSNVDSSNSSAGSSKGIKHFCRQRFIKHYGLTSMVQRSLQRTGSKQNAKVNVSFANWPPALRSADPPKTMVFYKCFVKQFDDVIQGFKLSAPTIWIQIVNFG